MSGRMLAKMVLLLTLAPLVSACYHDDTLEDVWPDPQERTWVILRGVNEAVISYWSEHDSLPSALAGLRGDRMHHVVMELDAWGQPLRYVRLDGAYCAWSSGPDSVLASEDDLGIHGQVVEGRATARQLMGGELRTPCGF